MAVYNLTQPIDRESFKKRCNALYEKECLVELTEKKPKRSLSQNNYLFLCLQYLAYRLGETLSCVENEYYKRECNSDLYVRRVFDRHLNREREELRHTYELTTSEMSISIDRLKNWAAAQGETLPDAERPEQIIQAYQMVESNKQWIVG